MVSFFFGLVFLIYIYSVLFSLLLFALCFHKLLYSDSVCIICLFLFGGRAQSPSFSLSLTDFSYSPLWVVKRASFLI
jgi:hypothetical protein